MEETRRDLAQHVAAHAEVIGSLSTAIVIFGPDKQLEFSNDAYAKMFDLDTEWLREKPLYREVLELLRTKRRLPEVPDFAAFRDKREAMFNDLIEPFEEVLFLPSGVSLHLKTTPHPFGGLMFTFEDVTDTLALESSLNTLIAVQSATLDNLYEGVAVFGGDGRLRLRNPGYARIWKLDVDQLDGEPHIAEILEMTKALYDHGDDWDSYKARIIAHTTERSPSFNRLDRTDDTVLEWASVPLPDGATLMTYLDVTDSNNVELALRERNEALQEADRLKSEFISNVSYELRTPLNTIIGFSELLSAGFFGSLETRQAEYVQGIFDSSQHLLQLVNDILDLATIEAGHMRLDVGSFNIDDMLDSILTLTHQRVLSENITLDYDCPASLGVMVGDERRIKQSIFHLLSNAIKFTPEGGTVALKVAEDEGVLVITVSDSGGGIPHDDLVRIFEKFWRRGNVPLHAAGTGLGLPLVKSFVELHGGHIEVESSDTGTTITSYPTLAVRWFASCMKFFGSPMIGRLLARGEAIPDALVRSLLFCGRISTGRMADAEVAIARRRQGVDEQLLV
jgi:signal transduction histidine kinase